jgi:hypothetical protein
MLRSVVGLRNTSFLPALVVGALLCAGVARADDAQARARALFEEGVGLAKENRWTDACPKFEQSLVLFPGIGTRGKLAECYEHVGRYSSAWQLWREVAQLAMRAGEPAREQVASEHAKALEPKLSYITVSAGPGVDTSAILVKRNGLELDRSKLGAAEPIDAGPIALEITAPGKKPVTTKLVVSPGESAKYEIPQLESNAPAPAPAPAPARATFPEPETEHGTWQKPTGLALAGAGVVGVAIGSVLGLSAKSTYDGAFDSGACGKATKQCSADGQSKVDDAHSKATVATIVFVAGVALAAGGAVLYLTAPSAKRRVGLAPVLTPAGGGLVLGGAL